MNKSLFIGMLVTLLVVLFSAWAVKANVQRNDATPKTVRAALLYATPVTFPKNNTKDTSSPEIKASGSVSYVQNSLCIRANYILFCLFEITFQKTYSDDSRPQIDIALHEFFLTLFNAIITPNAP